METFAIKRVQILVVVGTKVSLTSLIFFIRRYSLMSTIFDTLSFTWSSIIEGSNSNGLCCGDMSKLPCLGIRASSASTPFSTHRGFSPPTGDA